MQILRRLLVRLFGVDEGVRVAALNTRLDELEARFVDIEADLFLRRRKVRR